MNAQICAAIRSRAIVELYYEGGKRRVEPHCHGISMAGKEVLRAFQTAGFSESGQPVGWKLFEVAKIISFSQTGATFLNNRQEYNPNDHGMRRIHCRV
ncbi:hypothetical protein DCC62_06595 [candidate division KSB1 bacterium]|nr:MAG: hypothetical protein DCC62_06595 [candidate division KSB1 bacterium]